MVGAFISLEMQRNCRVDFSGRYNKNGQNQLKCTQYERTCNVNYNYKIITRLLHSSLLMPMILH